MGTQLLQRCIFIVYEKLACGPAKWKRKSHDGFWSTHDTHKAQLKIDVMRLRMSIEYK